jgi:hypothetical protein
MILRIREPLYGRPLNGVTLAAISEPRWHMRVVPRMRCLSLLLVLTLTGCSPAARDAPTTSPASTRPALALLSEPAADTRLLGRLHTVGDLSRLAPVAEVKIRRDLGADRAEKNGAAPITPENLEQLLAAGRPIVPGDKLIDGWGYAPWCRATFVAAGRGSGPLRCTLATWASSRMTPDARARFASTCRAAMAAN